MKVSLSLQLKTAFITAEVRSEVADALCCFVVGGAGAGTATVGCVTVVRGAGEGVFTVMGAFAAAGSVLCPWCNSQCSRAYAWRCLFVQ